MLALRHHAQSLKVAHRAQSSRDRKWRRSCILTDTPGKTEIEELAFKKFATEAHLNKKREENRHKLRNAELFIDGILYPRGQRYLIL